MSHVPHLFLAPPWSEPVLDLDDGQDHHLRRVLRLGEGDLVTYTDGKGTVGKGALSGRGVVRGEEKRQAPTAAPEVAVAPPASRHRQRFLVEKLGELGVRRLLWLRTRHGEGRPPPSEKSTAWARAALEQSRGAWVMEIGESALGELDPTRMVVADPTGDDLVEIPEPVLVVGPEGGWAPGEVPAAAARLSLGSTVLRVETAAIVGATLLAARRRCLH